MNRFAFLLVLMALSRAEATGFIRWEALLGGLDLGKGHGVLDISTGDQPPVAYVIVDQVGLYRWRKGEMQWTLLPGDIPPLRSPHTVAVSPWDGHAVFVGVAEPNVGLWVTPDGGQKWTRSGDGTTGMASSDVESIAFGLFAPDTAEEKLILVGHRKGRAISVSFNAGKTWVASDLGADLEAQLVFAVTSTDWVVTSRSGNGILYTKDSGRTWSPATGSVDYFPGPLPVVQVGDVFFSSKHHGFNKSVDGGKTWQFVMEQHTRVIGSAGRQVFRENRQPTPGKDDRVFTIEMSDNFGQSWADVTQGLRLAVPEVLRPNLVISNKVDPYAHVRIATAWSSSMEGRKVFLGLGKAGVYLGELMWTAKGPRMAEPNLVPKSIVEGDSRTTVEVRVTVSPRTGQTKKVYADLSAVGRQDLILHDDGQHHDAQADDKDFGNSFTVAPNVAPGEKSIGIVAEDDSGGLSSVALPFVVSAASAKRIVWDGEERAQGLSWISPKKPLHFFKAQAEEAHDGQIALEFHGEGSGYIGGGWNWFGWYPANSGTDITPYRNLAFWIKVEGQAKPAGIQVALVSSGENTKPTRTADLQTYCDDAMDGHWREVVIPLNDIYEKDSTFDPTHAWMLNVNTWSPTERNFSIYIDTIGFDNRPVRSRVDWVTLPEERESAPLGERVIDIVAEVDVKAPGTRISPSIYGAAMGHRNAAREMGIPILRAGGNPVTPLNWKKGFSSKGADWFFTNEGELHPPENNWLVTFHRENQKLGLQTYLTLPIMGRVAKDGTSAAYDIRKYPDQENWAGKAQPTDPHPNAGNGRQYVRGPDGAVSKVKDGKPLLREIEPDPDDTSVQMSPEEQADMLRFMIHEMGYGQADKGGVRFIALDNEPMLWHSTHRGMHPQGTSYEELWERTQTYASLLKKIDPGVKLAGPTLWGWTAYFHSGLDMQLIQQGKADWANPSDSAAHGNVPFLVWWLQKLKHHQEKTGQRLIDILDFHFYPQTGIYMAGAPNDPIIMEARVQETRVLWDPLWKDPSWMATDRNGARLGGKLQIIRLMKQWVAENCPGLEICLGEYNFGGEKDISGGVAQAELLGIFGREGLDHAYYWFFPAANSSHWFAFKMFRNPDGNHTPFGDLYLPVKISAPEEVSVHPARDSKTGALTFVLVNKRLAQGARVEIRLSQAIPSQEVTVYEYSRADIYAIGKLPPRKVDGEKIYLDLPPLSVLRFDIKP